MGRGRQLSTDNQRSHVASEAARILATEGINSFQLAKQKAADRLGNHQRRYLPSNDEIEQALRQYLQLFEPSLLPKRISALRSEALKAMNFLATFSPKLVGAVLRGTVTASSEIQLHLCADTTEIVATKLMEHDIPYEISSRRLRYGGNRHEEQPTFCITADGVAIELLVFTPSQFRENPLSPINGKVMSRATSKEVEKLLIKNNTDF